MSAQNKNNKQRKKLTLLPSIRDPYGELYDAMDTVVVVWSRGMKTVG
jgi:hypothetical protein